MKHGGIRMAVGSRHVSTVTLPAPSRAISDPVPARPIQHPSTSSLTDLEPFLASTAYATLKTASASALCPNPR